LTPAKHTLNVSIKTGLPIGDIQATLIATWIIKSSKWSYSLTINGSEVEPAWSKHGGSRNNTPRDNPPPELLGPPESEQAPENPVEEREAEIAAPRSEDAPREEPAEETEPEEANPSAAPEVETVTQPEAAEAGSSTNPEEVPAPECEDATAAAAPVGTPRYDDAVPEAGMKPVALVASISEIAQKEKEVEDDAVELLPWTVKEVEQANSSCCSEGRCGYWGLPGW
jgi:hypothetical protein